MATAGVNSSSQPLIPIFKGEKYHLWSLKMKTMFKSQELWDLVENGYVEPESASSEPNNQLRENRKKDAKALFLIQSALDDEIFPRITSATTAHQAWEILKQEYLGDQRVIKVRLQTSDGIFISQKKYATDLLKKFSMLNCKPAPTPMNVNEKLVAEDGTGMADARKYRSIVGGLNYLSHTRPDIAFSVSVISRFMHNPTEHHYGAAKRILRYICGTIDLGIWYKHLSNFRLLGFSDSDWAGCLEDRRSTSGYIFSLGSGAIAWSSKKQDVVALSSSEAEYIAVTGAACQAVWLRRLLADFLQSQEGETEIYCDNKATISMTKNPAFHSRTKHIDLRFHFIRDLVSTGEIVLKYCHTNEQVADILTKSLAQAKHHYLRMQLGVTNFEAGGVFD